MRLARSRQSAPDNRKPTLPATRPCTPNPKQTLRDLRVQPLYGRRREITLQSTAAPDESTWNPKEEKPCLKSNLSSNIESRDPARTKEAAQVHCL